MFLCDEFASNSLSVGGSVDPSIAATLTKNGI
jgi:hypothetical protein